MRAITYRICLEQPLLATMLAGDPNSSVSFDHIPGSLIRGVLVHRFINTRGIRTSDHLGDLELRRLFFDGTTRYLNAYPLSAGGERTLPTPRSLYRHKEDRVARGAQTTIYNPASPDWDAAAAGSGVTDGQPTDLAFPFVSLSDEGGALAYEPERRIAVHVARNRPRGRAVRQFRNGAAAGGAEESGTVFQYDALATGQWFAGAILAESEEDAATLLALFQESATAWLGRSRSAGYGRVRLLPDSRIRSSWHEAGKAPAAIDSGALVTLTLLSDTLLRDHAGQAVVTFAHQPRTAGDQSLIDDTILSRYLQRKVAIDSTRTFTEVAAVGGYSRTWRMPLAQTSALAAGSVLALRTEEPFDQDQVRRLLDEGIGERRAEGYGRIALDWMAEPRIDVRIGELYRDVPAPPTLSQAAETLARRMADRRLAQQVDTALARFVRQHLDRAERMPHNSQLGRVRVLVRRATADRNLASVRTGLSAFRPTSRQQFEQARLQDRSLWEWLNSLLERPNDVWTRLGLGEGQEARVLGFTPEMDGQVSAAIALRLIDTVLVAVARRRGQEERA